MIKGVGKQVVVLTNPESSIYEQAIFILKQPKGSCNTNQNMVEEAEKIINSHIFNSAMLSPRRSRWNPWLLVSLCAGICCAAAVSVLIFVLI